MRGGPWARLLFAGQLAGYALGLTGLVPAVAARSRLAAAAASFLVLNAAAWLGAWVWVSGKAGKSWRKSSYCWTTLSGARPPSAGSRVEGVAPMIEFLVLVALAGLAAVAWQVRNATSTAGSAPRWSSR